MHAHMLVRHKVSNFTVWKRIYDDHLPKRTEAGLTEKHLFRGVGDRHEVVILFEVRDVDRAKKFVESAELRETMLKAGVLDKPDIQFLDEEKAGAYARAPGCSTPSCSTPVN